MRAPDSPLAALAEPVHGTICEEVPERRTVGEEVRASTRREDSNAYLFLAHDPTADSDAVLLRTLPVAHALHEVTSHPIIVLTNETHFGDGTPVEAAFGKIGVSVRPIHFVDVPDEYLHRKYAAKCKSTCGYTFFKLQAWRMTQFRKIVMMDTDAIVTGSLDHLFDLEGTWAQEERWWCNPTGFMSGGLVVLTPNETDFQGMLEWAKHNEIPAADQSTISGYFGMAKHGEPNGVHLLDMADVDYGACMNSHHTPPPFVHKSDRKNYCMALRAEAKSPQCRDIQMAKLWRKHLCAALAETGVSFAEKDEYCEL